MGYGYALTRTWDLFKKSLGVVTQNHGGKNRRKKFFLREIFVWLRGFLNAPTTF